MKIMIVDDEALALNRLERLLRDAKLENIIAFSSPLEALAESEKTKFDAVFLDISMPHMSGLELANQIVQNNPATFIVFQSAYDQYALEAFQSGGMCYLLKPISAQSIAQVVEKIKLFKSTPQPINKKIIGKRGEKIYIIDIDDIYYIKADLDEINVRIQETEVYLKRKIGDFEHLLQGKNFFRIHRSYIINVDKIKSMQSIEQSKLQIAFDGIDTVVTSSKEGAKDFREYLESRSL